MLGMKNHFDISGSIEIREVDIAGVACTLYVVEGSEKLFTFCMVSIFRKTFRTEWFQKFVFNFNLTGV